MVAINVGQDFKKRWLKAPEAVRLAFIDDLNRIHELLEDHTQLESWLDHDQRAKQIAQLKIEQAYADEKTRLIEEARVRKQLALENSLALKRANQEAYNQQLLQDELQQHHQQTESLVHLKSLIDTEINQYTRKYNGAQSRQQIPAPIIFNNSQATVSCQPDTENLRLRLELEAENLIDEALKKLKEQLKIAATEEIELLLAQQDHTS